MKKNSILVKTVLMSMLTAATITSFTSCQDDLDIDTAPQMETDITSGIDSNITPASHRVINFEGVDNARDMGGLVMQDGRTVCFDKLVRSGKLAKATDADVAILQDRYHLSDVFDFRFDLEMTEASDRVINGVTYTQVSTMPKKIIEAQAKFGAGSGQLSTPGMVETLLKYAFDPTAQELAKQLYPLIVTDPQSQANYGKFLHGVLAAKGGVLWHCSEGKDRCGWGSALLLAALGASRQVIVDDFDKSNESYAEQVEAVSAQVRDKDGGAAAADFIQAMVGVSTPNFEAALDLIDQQYGSMEQYLENQLGFSKEEQMQLRAKYLTVSLILASSNRK